MWEQRKRNRIYFLQALLNIYVSEYIQKLFYWHFDIKSSESPALRWPRLANVIPGSRVMWNKMREGILTYISLASKVGILLALQKFFAKWWAFLQKKITNKSWGLETKKKFFLILYTLTHCFWYSKNGYFIPKEKFNFFKVLDWFNLKFNKNRLHLLIKKDPHSSANPPCSRRLCLFKHIYISRYKLFIAIRWALSVKRHIK